MRRCYENRPTLWLRRVGLHNDGSSKAKIAREAYRDARPRKGATGLMALGVHGVVR